MCGSDPPYARSARSLLFLVVLLLLSFGPQLVSGRLENRTIDDVKGDTVTGQMVHYLPQTSASGTAVWENQTSCAGCTDVPDASQTYDNTWSAALYTASLGSLSVSFKFSGTAIYIFFVLPNFDPGSGLASSVNCQFFIDGVLAGSFTHDSDGTGNFNYNALVFQSTSIPNGDHTLLIQTTGANPEIIIFDYAIYTADIPDQPTDSTPTPTPPPPQPPPSATAQQANVNSDTTNAPQSSSGQSSPPTSLPTPSPSPDSDKSALDLPAPNTANVPFLTSISSDPTSSNLPAQPVADTSGSQRTTHIIAIVGSVAGGAILSIFLLLFIVLYRQRQRRRRAQQQGFVSVFDRLDHSPPPPPSPPQRHRPLPAPPTPTTQMSELTDGDLRRHPMAAGHSAQSSVSIPESRSSYTTDPRADLHIRIPRASFYPSAQVSEGSRTPLSGSLTPDHSHSRSLSNVPNPLSASYLLSPANASSYIGSPLTARPYAYPDSPSSQTNLISPAPSQSSPPEKAEFMAYTTSGRAPRTPTSANTRGPYTPTAPSAGSSTSPWTSEKERMAQEEQRQQHIDEDELRTWGPPLVHVDSGIRFGDREELPPQYEPR